MSSLGRVRSEPSSHTTPGRQRGRILAASPDSKGYRCFRICIPGQPVRYAKVHRAVAAAFLGPPQAGQQVNHRNGLKSDNRVENLEYVTCRENIRHCWENGLHGVEHCRGEASRLAKLTESNVRIIRREYPRQSLSQLAREFGVTKQAIWHIVKRKTWVHI